MNIELKLLRISARSILKMIGVGFLLVNIAAWLSLKYGMEESLSDLFIEEWILLEVLGLLLGLLFAFGKSKAEMICFYDVQPSRIHQRLERWMKIKSYKKTSHETGVEVWDYSSLFKRCWNLFEGDIRIESTGKMLKITGPPKYVTHIKNKLIWSREFAPTQKIQKEELAKV